MTEKQVNPLLAQLMKASKPKTEPHIEPTKQVQIKIESPVPARPEDLMITQLQPEMMPAQQPNPFLTPASQSLTRDEPAVEGIVEETVAAGAAFIAGEQVHVVEQLARMDTSDLEPKESNGPREPNEMLAARKMDAKLVLDETNSVRALCDKIDVMLESNPNLAGPPLFELRNHVQTLMITLKQRPEFDSVLIAKDVRNVMKFIRAARNQALELREVKSAKKVVRTAKKDGIALALGDSNALASAINAALGSFGKK